MFKGKFYIFRYNLPVWKVSGLFSIDVACDSDLFFYERFGLFDHEHFLIISQKSPNFSERKRVYKVKGQVRNFG